MIIQKPGCWSSGPVGICPVVVGLVEVGPDEVGPAVEDSPDGVDPAVEGGPAGI